MDERQKKIIKNTLLVIGLLITISCFAIFVYSQFVEKENNNYYWSKSLGTIGTFAPTIIGAITKIYLSIFIRKQNIKAIDNHLVESGIKPLSTIKKSNKHSKKIVKNDNKKDNQSYGY